MCASAAYVRVPQKQMLKGEACPETISVLPLFFLLMLTPLEQDPCIFRGVWSVPITIPQMKPSDANHAAGRSFWPQKQSCHNSWVTALITASPCTPPAYFPEPPSETSSQQDFSRAAPTRKSLSLRSPNPSKQSAATPSFTPNVSLSNKQDLSPGLRHLALPSMPAWSQALPPYSHSSGWAAPVALWSRAVQGMCHRTAALCPERRLPRAGRSHIYQQQ